MCAVCLDFVAQGGDPTGTGEGECVCVCLHMYICTYVRMWPFTLAAGGESVYGQPFKVSTTILHSKT